MHEAYFHEDSDAVRFWVPVDDGWMGASISRTSLHHLYSPQKQGEDPLVSFRAHLPELTDAVHRRIAKGSIEPVMLREFDLRPTPMR
jgi:hypothetical protein